MSPTQSRGRVLIVDDERSIRNSYARLLKQAGFEVEEASTGAEAMQRIERTRFDVVFTDVSLPGMDGLTLLRRMRSRSGNLAVVLMVETHDNATAVKAAAAGALQYLVKPIDSAALQESAEYGVRLQRARRGATVAFRNRRGEHVDASSFSATDAKKEFGRVLEVAVQGGLAVITKHDAPKAVVLSIEEFNALAGANERKLDTLSEEFDTLLARMQTPDARTAMEVAFGASPKELGAAAVNAARKRRG